jgi:hypothetical protein
MSDAHGVVLTENHFVKALADVGLVADAEYSNASLVNSATLLLYDVLLTGANLSEGGLSYSVSVEGIKAAKLELETRMGVKKNTINTKRAW